MVLKKGIHHVIVLSKIRHMKRQADKEVGSKSSGEGDNNSDIVADSIPPQLPQSRALDKKRVLKKFCLSQHHGDRIASAVADARFKEEALGRLINKEDSPDIELQLLSDSPIVLRCHCEEEYYSQWLLYWPRDQEVGEKLLRWLDEPQKDHVDMVWALQWVAERPDEDHSVIGVSEGSDLDTYDSIKVLAKLGITSTAQLGYLRLTISPMAGREIQEGNTKKGAIALETLNPRLFVVDCHAFE